MLTALLLLPFLQITEARVREVLTFLAADEMEGRDTPSAGQDKAAEFIAEAFKKAGLEPGAKDQSWFHTYEQPCLELEASTLQVTLHSAAGDTVLAPGKDVRLWRAGRAFEQTAGEVLLVDLDAARDKGIDRRMGGTKPVLLVVAEDSPLWRAAGVKRQVLAGQAMGGRRGGGGPPEFLIRAAALRDRTATSRAAPAAGNESAPAPAELKATIKVPEPRTAQVQLRNVVGVLPGDARKDEFVVFSAHYDHIGVRLPVNGDAVCNGADDDASGTTAVVTLAEEFARERKAGKPLPRTLVFVCFSAEEKGLIGSHQFCVDPPIALDKVAVDLNLEMLGRPAKGKENQAWITGSDLSDFAAIAAAPMKAAGVEVVDFAMGGTLFYQSDNVSLAAKGVVAHSISAGYLHPDYHQPSDEVTKIAFPHMTAVIRAIHAAGVEFASRETAPAWNEKGERVLNRLRGR